MGDVYAKGRSTPRAAAVASQTMVTGWSAVHAMQPLPALYVATLTLAGAAALRRWFDPVPAKVLLLFGVYVAVLLAPVLVGDGVLLPLDVLPLHAPYQELPASVPPGIPLQRDLVHQVVPWQLEVKRALLDGRWPLWNAHQGAGMPLLADPQAQAFQPLAALAYPFTIWTAAAVTAALRILTALVFSFLLLRRQGLGEAAATAGATAFGLSGFILLWLGWPIATCGALLPAMLYAIVRCDQNGGRRDTLLLALTTAALVLGGHPETLTYVLIGALLFLLARCRQRATLRTGLALALRGGTSMLLAVALTAPVLLPTLAYLPTTQRSAIVRFHLQPVPLQQLWHGLTQAAGLAQWRRFAVQRLAPLVAPDALGDQFTTYWGENNYIQDTSTFAGSITLLFALSACWGLVGAGRRRFPQERWAGAVLAGSLALLAQPPGFDHLAARLPLVGMTAIHRHQRLQVWVAFCLSYLAACQIDRWRQGHVRPRALLLGGATAMALVAGAYLANPNPNTQDLVHDAAGLAVNERGDGALARQSAGYLRPTPPPPGEPLWQPWYPLCSWSPWACPAPWPPASASAPWDLQAPPGRRAPSNLRTPADLQAASGLKEAADLQAFSASPTAAGRCSPSNLRAPASLRAPSGLKAPSDLQASSDSVAAPDLRAPAGLRAAWSAWAPWDFRIHWLGVQLATLLAGIGCVALAATPAAVAARRRRRASPWAAAIARRAPWVLIVILAGELLAFYRSANPPNDARLAFPRLPAVRFLQTNAGDDRIVGTPTVLPANFASVYGLCDVRVDDPSGPFAYQRATSFLDHGALEPRFGRFGHPLYDFLGVRYVISRPGARLPLTRVYADNTAWIWERPHPLDRLFLPERAIATGEEGWESWLDTNPDFGFRVLLEPGLVPGVERHWRAADPDASHLEDPILIGPTWVHAAGVFAEPRLLAAGIYQDGGWRVLAGGWPLAPVRVNGAFVGAWLPAGQGTVDLLYRPPAHSCGCILAALALAAGAAWWVQPPQHNRNSSLSSKPSQGMGRRRQLRARPPADHHFVLPSA
jgi:hypothetical protein